MALVFETVYTAGIAQLSYLIGDSGSQTAAVIDPRPDCQVYLDLARQAGVAITHVLETHNHADFMSGARDLAARVGNARICLSELGGTQYDFPHQTISDGQSWDFGSLRLTARHTPGHTLEHMSFLAASSSQPDAPWGVFSGDSLFVGSAGRPDLVHGDGGKDLPGMLFRTLREFYLELDDSVMLFPCHGAGSACGAKIGDRRSSTIGHERRTNPFLQYEDQAEFERFVAAGNPPEPTHYSRLKKLNAAGPPVLGRLPTCPALPLADFTTVLATGECQLVDTRDPIAFAGGHIAGTLNLGNRPDLSTWAGWLLDPETPILLVLGEDADLQTVLARLLHVGYSRFAGYLIGGMTTWVNDAQPIRQIGLTTPDWLDEQLASERDTLLLDVRSPSEYRDGHIPGARHIHLPDLADQAAALSDEAEVVVYCGSGYRASIAASILAAHDLVTANLAGGIGAWKRAGLDTESS